MTIVTDYSKIRDVKTVSISEFKSTCLELLRQVRETGSPILVTKHGEPIAEVRPPQRVQTRSPIGIMKGRGEILDDIVAPASPAEEWDVLQK